MEKLTKDEVKELVLRANLTITDVIDAVIEINGIIGVGLITLGSELNEYCTGKITRKDDKDLSGEIW